MTKPLVSAVGVMLIDEGKLRLSDTVGMYLPKFAEMQVLDAQGNLTPLGGDLARLPIDPTLGRMLLQSQQELGSQLGLESALKMSMILRNCKQTL